MDTEYSMLTSAFAVCMTRHSCIRSVHDKAGTHAQGRKKCKAYACTAMVYNHENTGRSRPWLIGIGDAEGLRPYDTLSKSSDQ